MLRGQVFGPTNGRLHSLKDITIRLPMQHKDTLKDTTRFAQHKSHDRTLLSIVEDSSLHLHPLFTQYS
jgi:hypothetical protein